LNEKTKALEEEMKKFWEMRGDNSMVVLDKDGLVMAVPSDDWYNNCHKVEGYGVIQACFNCVDSISGIKGTDWITLSGEKYKRGKVVPVGMAAIRYNIDSTEAVLCVNTPNYEPVLDRTVGAVAAAGKTFTTTEQIKFEIEDGKIKDTDFEILKGTYGFGRIDAIVKGINRITIYTGFVPAKIEIGCGNERINITYGKEKGNKGKLKKVLTYSRVSYN
jgi:hypothetical protein